MTQMEITWRVISREGKGKNGQNGTENKKHKGRKKDEGEIDGSRVHFPLHIGERPSLSTEEQSEQLTVPQHL